ncbi:glutamyl-tRNA reductase [Brachybacterium huguangmaarense]|uniref:Glutamyl-tRNA reductase n=1 Tax=Brachybacterium huguangmaarense TaxID=1652028 RepID=A0ABY6G487_9MICO|nr:glutamyl-tRNA reductase [Brachybacterium huguangmaarense]UYG17922.1 glutamyl-tRNA reductase [Brachybacterium huguangmaarense]
MLVALRATHEHLDLGVLDALTRGSEHLGHVIEKLNAQAAGEAVEAVDVAALESGAPEPDTVEAAEDATPPLAGWVVVSTCNRLEIYLDAHRFHDGVDLAARAVAATSSLSAEQVSLCLEAAMGAPVAEHLYEVTAGLRSIVLGEAEIAGQVHAAFERAHAAGYTSPMLNDLFQIGFRYAKRVAARTPVGAAGRSGVAIALDRAADILGPLEHRSVLVIGTGAYARLGVAELTRRGVRDVHVHSASGRAVAFAERQGVAAIEAAQLPERLREADLVLACSGRGTSLFPELFLQVGPTLILDLALHSDLHPLVRHLADVQVLDLTDLTIEADDSAAPALAAAREIVAEGVESFRSRQEFRRVDPAMAALRRSVNEAADAEIARLRRGRAQDEADALAADVERSIRRILAKVMHSPATRARRLAQEGNAGEFVDAFHTIFGIDISAPDGEVTAGREGAPAGWMRLDQTVPPALDGAGLPAPDRTALAAELVRAAAQREGGAACPIETP